MKFMKFGKTNKKFLIPILGGVIGLIYRFMIPKIPKYGIIAKNPFIFNIYVSIGMILAFIPYLIIKYNSKLSPLSEAKMESKINSDIIRNNKLLNNTLLKTKLILYSTIFDYMQCLLNTLFCYYCIYNLWIFDILLMSLFSYIILKTKLYKHQYFSMIIILIFGFILNIIEYYKLDDKDKQLNFFEIFMNFFLKYV